MNEGIKAEVKEISGIYYNVCHVHRTIELHGKYYSDDNEVTIECDFIINVDLNKDKEIEVNIIGIDIDGKIKYRECQFKNMILSHMEELIDKIRDTLYYQHHTIKIEH